MKKMMSIMILLGMLCSLGWGMAEASVGMPDPIQEYESLEEINQITGCRLTHPGVMGVTEEKYRVIDCGDHRIGEYEFEVNGMMFCFRCCNSTTEDISGIYIDGKPVFEDMDAAEIQITEGEGYRLARWFTLEGQYCLMLKNGEAADESGFQGIAKEMAAMTAAGLGQSDYEAFYAELAGVYFDRYSQRASAVVTANGSESAGIIISWGSSAMENTTWEMTLTLAEDGILYYSDGVKTNWVYADDGTVTSEVEYTGGEGFFSCNDGQLFWNGAEEDYCQACEFAKDEEIGK